MTISPHHGGIAHPSCTHGRKANTSSSRDATDRVKETPPPFLPLSFWSTYGALDDDSFAAPDEIDPALDAFRGSFDD